MYSVSTAIPSPHRCSHFLSPTPIFQFSFASLPASMVDTFILFLTFIPYLLGTAIYKTVTYGEPSYHCTSTEHLKYLHQITFPPFSIYSLSRVSTSLSHSLYCVPLQYSICHLIILVF